MPLLRPALGQMLRPLRHSQTLLPAMRTIATTPVRSNAPLMLARLQKQDSIQASEAPFMSAATSGGAALAASPLLLTEPPAPGFNFGEFQFILGKQINGVMESMAEVEGGPLFLNALGLMALLRFGFYYC
mmetsp:Transcript_76100/g.138643  ORF Transcript_76100/g.138643 Transcript_76100/m.138643 type:complete len:130 (-) Transcript_76100:14-403(-)